MNPDETWFLQECKRLVGTAGNVKQTPRDIINEPGFQMNHKRAHYLLRKWAKKGIYNYGVSLDLGWMEDES